MFAVTVTFMIMDGRMLEFMPLMLANARTSLNEEAGCLQFDVCTDPARPGEVFLYELYADAAAFEVHLESPHFKAFDEAVADMVGSKTAWTFAEVAQ